MLLTSKLCDSRVAATRQQVQKMMSSIREIDKGVYSAFGSGDIPGVLSALAPDVHWTEVEGGPHGGVFIGPDAVLENVLMKIGSEWDDFAAVPREFVAEGETVIALGEYSGFFPSIHKYSSSPPASSLILDNLTSICRLGFAALSTGIAKFES